MKFLYGLVLFSLSLPVSAQTWFSTEDFAGSWRIEHLDADSQTSTLTELYFDESGSFYSQSLVSSE